MKIKLLNDGGYGYFPEITLPVVVEAKRCTCGYDVPGSEIIKLGGDPEIWDADYNYFWAHEEVGVLP